MIPSFDADGQYFGSDGRAVATYLMIPARYRERKYALNAVIGPRRANIGCTFQSSFPCIFSILIASKRGINDAPAGEVDDLNFSGANKSTGWDECAVAFQGVSLADSALELRSDPAMHTTN